MAALIPYTPTRTPVSPADSAFIYASAISQVRYLPTPASQPCKVRRSQRHNILRQWPAIRKSVY